MSTTQDAWVTAAFVSVVLLGVLVFLWRHVIVPERRRVAAALAHLAATEPAHARVLAVRAPGHETGEHSAARLLLEVYRPDRPAYRIAHTAFLGLHQAAEFQPGHLIDVRVDKTDPTIVYLPPDRAARGEPVPMHIRHRFLVTLPFAIFVAACANRPPAPAPRTAIAETHSAVASADSSGAESPLRSPEKKAPKDPRQDSCVRGDAFACYGLAEDIDPTVAEPHSEEPYATRPHKADCRFDLFRLFSLACSAGHMQACWRLSHDPSVVPPKGD
jgi:hypothetical protein